MALRLLLLLLHDVVEFFRDWRLLIEARVNVPDDVEKRGILLENVPVLKQRRAYLLGVRMNDIVHDSGENNQSGSLCWKELRAVDTNIQRCPTNCEHDGHSIRVGLSCLLLKYDIRVELHKLSQLVARPHLVVLLVLHLQLLMIHF